MINMLSINISELIWTIVNFFLLYFLLKHFLYDPLVSFMDERKSRIDRGQEIEKEVLEAVSAEEISAGKELANARAEAARIIASAADAEKAEQDRLMSDAEARAAEEMLSARNAVREQYSRSGEKLAANREAYARSLADVVLSKYGK